MSTENSKPLRKGSKDSADNTSAKKVPPSRKASSARKKTADYKAQEPKRAPAQKTEAVKTEPISKEHVSAQKTESVSKEQAAPISPVQKMPQKTKMLLWGGVAAVVLVAAGVWMYLSFSISGKLLFEYNNNEGKTVRVTFKDAMAEIRPLLEQAPQQAVDELQDGVEAIKNVAISVNLYPRLMVEEALKISNFKAGADYQQRLSDYLATLPATLAFNKGLEEINKTVDKEKITTAEISRIFVKKLGNTGVDIKALEMASNILEGLKSSSNILEDFSRTALDKSQEPIGAQAGGYFGEIVKGAYPGIDPVVFGKSAPEGLYPEVIDAPEAYYLVYVHTPAKEVPLKEMTNGQNAETRFAYITSYLNKNAELLYRYEDKLLSADGKEADPASLTPSTPIARFWNKSYTVGDLSSMITLISGPGTVPPQPAELVQLLSDTNAMYRSRLAILTKSYKPGAAPSKEFVQASNSYVTKADQQAANVILQETLLGQISTNVSPAEYQSAYNSMPEKPIKEYKPDGTPIYATLKESQAQLQQEILRYRMQQKLMEMLARLTQEHAVVWQDKNLEAFKSMFNKEYAKLQIAQVK